nr:hypothetical protein [Bacteroidia bacterium]
INIGKRLTFGVLEGIIWEYDSTRAFDIQYMNPVIFLRPVEFSIGSPDNALIGFNARYKLNGQNYLYGQLMLDEFKLNEVLADSGWWGNKQAFQLGFRMFNPFGINNLIFGSEFNYSRPFTYQHKSSATAYAHYNQPLAHPVGANFWESVTSVGYSYKRWHANLKINYTKVGYDIDSAGTVINYGNNVLLSYIPPSQNHPYGNETLQGLETTVINGDLRLWYLLNPVANLVIEGGTRIRQTDNIYGSTETIFFYIGLRTTLTNRYFDF